MLKEIELTASIAAKKAGLLLKSGFRQKHKVSFKGTVDLVTEMDMAAESLIKKELENYFPKIRFFGEENGGCKWNDEKVWVVDPLDGTTNYANGLEHFCVSIAYCENGEPLVGIIYRPISDDLYSCIKNQGSFLNGSRISVNSETDINQALAVTGFPYNRRECLDDLLSHLRVMLNNVQGVRRLGSAALDLCYMAQGLFSVYWETNLKPWDIAAGKLLVTEAGGTVTKFNGEIMHLDSMELLATNTSLHKEVIQLLSSTN